MGLLDTSNLEADTAPELDAEAPEAPEPEQGGADEGPKLSRREAAKLSEAQISSYEQKAAALEKQAEETRAAMAERDRQLAHMHGQLEQIAKSQQQSAKPAEPAGPDPEELREQAAAALEAGNVTKYEKLRDQAVKIEILKDIEAKAPARTGDGAAPTAPGTAGAQLPIEVQVQLNALSAQHPEVASLPNWMARLDHAIGGINMDPETRALPHSEKIAMAFEDLAARAKPAGKARPQYSRGNRAMLAGGPHTPSGGDTDADDAEQLSDDEKRAARAFGISQADYIASKNHSRVFKG